jgi:hypothetical protein
MFRHLRHDKGSNATGSAAALLGHMNGQQNGNASALFPRLVGPEASAA